MSIKRPVLSFDRDFTIMPNAWTRDGRLSLRARGLLAQLLSHRPGWEVTIESLMRVNPEGRDAIRRAISELEEYGYLKRDRAREGNKFAGMDYTIQEPSIPSVGFSDVGNPYVGESTHKEDHSSQDQDQEDHPERAVAVAPAPARKRASRLPEGWMPRQDVIEQMRAECSHVDLEAEHRKFQDHWAAASGKSATKLDWDATWRNWIRRAAEFTPRTGATGAPMSRRQQEMAEYERRKGIRPGSQWELER